MIIDRSTMVVSAVEMPAVMASRSCPDRLIMDTDQYDYYITFDNFKVGQFQGRAIVEALGLATTTSVKYITLFAGSPTDNNAFYFFDGAMSELRPYVEKGVLKIVGPAPLASSDTANFTRIATENWRADLAKQRMENLLNGDAKNYVLDAVLAPNDTLARAIIEALLTDAKYINKIPVVTVRMVSCFHQVHQGRQQAMTVFMIPDLAKAPSSSQTPFSRVRPQHPGRPPRHRDVQHRQEVHQVLPAEPHQCHEG